MKKTLKVFCYWFLSCTWGSIMTSIGLLVSFGLLIAGNKPKRFGYSFYFEVGRGWGGVSLGPVFFVNQGASLDLKQHEAGHGIQNTWLGPLFPFLIGIPSMIRYWLFDCKNQTGRIKVTGWLLFPLFLAYVLVFITLKYREISLFFLISNIVGQVIFYYLALLELWLVDFEIPKYEIKIPDYDEIWFEGLATKLGQERWPEEKSNVQ